MSTAKIISATTEDEVWQQLSSDFAEGTDVLEYSAIINHGKHRVALNIDIDLGGGFESGYETTSFVSTLSSANDVRFAIHHEGFLDEVGKFLGMQDVEIGYPEFDKNVIIKTNDTARIRSLFSDAEVRRVVQSLHSFSFGVKTHNDGRLLELTIERGITNLAELKDLYHTFITVLNAPDL